MANRLRTVLAVIRRWEAQLRQRQHGPFFPGRRSIAAGEGPAGGNPRGRLRPGVPHWESACYSPGPSGLRGHGL